MKRDEIASTGSLILPSTDSRDLFDLFVHLSTTRVRVRTQGTGCKSAAYHVSEAQVRWKSWALQRGKWGRETRPHPRHPSKHSSLYPRYSLLQLIRSLVQFPSHLVVCVFARSFVTGEIVTQSYSPCFTRGPRTQEPRIKDLLFLVFIFVLFTTQHLCPEFLALCPIFPNHVRLCCLFDRRQSAPSNPFITFHHAAYSSGRDMDHRLKVLASVVDCLSSKSSVMKIFYGHSKRFLN